ncbi:MAG: methyltransferase [Epsilonproteobacteria bacterium]|nr:methyltransferase [Campylobacterota bacterium]
MLPKHAIEFDRFALEYEKYKIIQTKVATHLIHNTPYYGRRILDLGAGSGEVYKAIFWEFDQFFALDISKNLLQLHPKKGVKFLVCDFDKKGCWEKVEKLGVDFIVASSSLQWSKNLSFLFQQAKAITQNIAFSIFTSNTFKTLHQLLGISSPIPSKKDILTQICQHFLIDYEVKEYKLFFPNRYEMLRYIKRTGVSSGKKRVGVKELRRVLREYPYPYLEFEVVFIWSKR